MSKIALPALYQSDTFSSSLRNRGFHAGTVAAAASEPPVEAGTQAAPRAKGFTPARASGFLVQMIVATGADLRKSLGRRDVAEHREAAYGAADANRPSRSPGVARLVELSA